eukprot:6491248-Amphidinium_carterae.2
MTNFNVLEVAMGLRVNFFKTDVVLTGTRDIEQWTNELMRRLDQSSDIRLLHITRHAKHLGLLIGDRLYDTHIIAEMEARSGVLHDMAFGLARHLQLLWILAVSVSSHTMSCYAPSLAFIKRWKVLCRRFGGGERGWARSFGHYARELLGWPANIPDIVSHFYKTQIKAMLRTQLNLVDMQTTLLDALRALQARTRSRHGWIAEYWPHGVTRCNEP